MLLDAQFRRVLEQVAGAVDAGDAAKDAASWRRAWPVRELEVRTQNYKIRSRVGSYEARMPVRSTKLLTTVVTNKRSWPRSVMAVTQGEGNVVPQLLTLTQASPRENYKLVSSTPLQPGATFPGIGRAGTETLAPSDKTGLLYSGDEALAGLGDRLTTADSAFKDKLVEGQSSPYIADTLAYQADVVKSGVNGTFAFTHKAAADNTVVFRTADGGALVLGRLNFSFDGTPKADGDKLTIGDDAAALAGGKETSTGMVLDFAESVAVYVPPAGSKDPMKLVAATRGLVGAASSSRAAHERDSFRRRAWWRRAGLQWLEWSYDYASFPPGPASCRQPAEPARRRRSLRPETAAGAVRRPRPARRRNAGPGGPAGSPVPRPHRQPARPTTPAGRCAWT